jgi:hypothetical protein
MKTPPTIEGEGRHVSGELPSLTPAHQGTSADMRLAKSLGLKAVKVTDFKNHRDIGKHFDDAGAVHIARGMFLLNQKATENAICSLHAALASVSDDPDKTMKMAGVMIDLLKHHGEMAERIDKSAGREKFQGGAGGPTQPMLPPSSSNVVVGVTVNGSVNSGSHVRPETTVLRSSGNLHSASAARKED